MEETKSCFHAAESSMTAENWPGYWSVVLFSRIREYTVERGQEIWVKRVYIYTTRTAAWFCNDIVDHEAHTENHFICEHITVKEKARRMCHSSLYSRCVPLYLAWLSLHLLHSSTPLRLMNDSVKPAEFHCCAVTWTLILSRNSLHSLFLHLHLHSSWYCQVTLSPFTLCIFIILLTFITTHVRALSLWPLGSR